MVRYIGRNFNMGIPQRGTLAEEFNLSVDDVEDIERRVKTILGRAIIPPELLTGNAQPYEGD